MPLTEQIFQSNRKINTVSGLTFFLVKIFISVIREAIYHVKGIYIRAFKSSFTRMAQSFHIWPSLALTQCREPIPSLLLLPATLPDSTTGRAVRGNVPGFTPCKTNSHLSF